MTEFTPFDYQEKAIQFIKDTPRCALWLPMSAGKTSSALEVIKYHLDQGTETKRRKKPTLIVAPLTVTYVSWVNEIKKWNNFKHLTYAILHGKDKEKTYLEQTPDIYLLNYDGVSWFVNFLIREKLIKFNSIIFDESSKLKNWATTRFKACRKLANSVSRVMHLSATPSPNHYLDLWSQYFLLDKGERLGRTITSFKDEFFTHNEYAFSYTLKDGAAEEIMKRVADITYRISEVELPPKPELQTHEVRFDLPAPLRKKYDKLEDEMFYTLDADITAQGEENARKEVTAFNAASLINKLRQFVQGFLYYEDEALNRYVEEVHTVKVTLLQELVESLQGEPVLVAYHYQHEYDMIRKVLGDVPRIGSGCTPKELKQYEKEWNEHKLPVLIVNPASVSHGLNLQDGGRNIIWYALTYSWEQYTQLIGRLHRTGQTQNVRNHILIANNTVDELILTNLRKKDENQTHFLDSLYAYRQAMKTKALTTVD